MPKGRRLKMVPGQGGGTKCVPISSAGTEEQVKAPGDWGHSSANSELGNRQVHAAASD
jgi:hypothetical protein